jgi:hypothetical protein
MPSGAISLQNGWQTYTIKVAPSLPRNGLNRVEFRFKASVPQRELFREGLTGAPVNLTRSVNGGRFTAMSGMGTLDWEQDIKVLTGSRLAAAFDYIRIEPR